MVEKIKYKRVLLKVSGELFSFNENNLNEKSLFLLESLKEIISQNIQVSIVIGGGNIIRGVNSKASNRVSSDQMGMLATIINGIHLKELFLKENIDAELLSSINVGNFVEVYSQKRVKKYLSQKKVLIFVGGIGNPYFSTDTTAVLRALEVKADLLLKATKVDGVYDQDPNIFKNAKKFEKISYNDCMKKNLKFMDQTAISLAKEEKLKIIVFDLFKKGSIINALTDKNIGTFIGV